MSHHAAKDGRISDKPCSVASEIPAGDWDAFVLGHPEPYLEQLSCWGEVKRAQGWECSNVALVSDGAVVAGAQVIGRTVGRLLKVAYVNRGPLLADDGLGDRMIEEMKRFVRARRYAYLAVSLPYGADALVESLKSAGFVARPPRLPPAVWLRATLIIDLLKTPAALMADMRDTMRKQVRRAERAGVAVREGREADLSCFCSLVHALCGRRGTSSNMPSEPLVRNLWRDLAPSGRMKLFMAELAGRPLCGLMVVTMGSWARAWRIGWSGDEPKSYPTQAVYWAAIQWAQSAGYRYFDVTGLDERDAREILNGRPADAPFHCSITQFKIGFGGTVRVLPGEYCYFPNPVFRWMFNRLAPVWAGR